MKRFLLLVITFVMVFIYISNVSAESNYIDNYEREMVIDFNNLTNNKINSIFENLDIFMIDIDVEILGKVRTYKINTYLSNDVEREITRRIIGELIDENEREVATIVEIKGYRVIRAKLICSDRTLNIIKSRL